jgi:hypothetical protein
VFTARYGLKLYVIILVNFSSLSPSMAQSDLLPPRPEFNPRPLHVIFLGHKVALEIFLLNTSGFPVQYSTSATYSSLSTCCCYQEDKQAKPDNLPEVLLFRESGSIG